MTVLDGRAMAAELRAELKAEVAQLRERGVVPTLAVVAVGDDPAARSYVRGMERAAAALDVTCTVRRLADTITAEELSAILDDLSANAAIHGILLQTPLPAGLDVRLLGACITIEKDVDGLNPDSAGRLLVGLPGYAPATAAAVMEILHRAAIPLSGTRAVVIGRSAIVGKPVALLLLQENATVTICHSRTIDLPSIARGADVLIVAIGRPRFAGAEFVKPGSVVIDVGINELDGAIVGDVDYDAVATIAGAITPVPGGVGPLTNVMLLRNTIAAARSLTNR